MDNDDQRDSVEERYNADLCPLCDYSPCIRGSVEGSCETVYDPNDPNDALQMAFDTVEDIDRLNDAPDLSEAGLSDLAVTLAGLFTNLADLAASGRLPDDWQR